MGTGAHLVPEHDDRPLLEKVDRLITPLTSGSARWLVESFQADEQLLDARDLGRPVRVIHLVRHVRWLAVVSALVAGQPPSGATPTPV